MYVYLFSKCFEIYCLSEEYIVVVFFNIYYLDLELNNTSMCKSVLPCDMSYCFHLMIYMMYFKLSDVQKGRERKEMIHFHRFCYFGIIKNFL